MASEAGSQPRHTQLTIVLRKAPEGTLWQGVVVALPDGPSLEEIIIGLIGSFPRLPSHQVDYTDRPPQMIILVPSEQDGNSYRMCLLRAFEELGLEVKPGPEP